MLNRDAGSDVLGDEGDVCVQSGGERVQMVDEYNNNSRNFANENKLGKAIVTTVTSLWSREQLTRCHQTSYNVPLTCDKSCNSATSQSPPNVRGAMSKGPALPSVLSRESHHGSIFARVAA